MQDRAFEGVTDTLCIPLTARVYVSKRFPEYSAPAPVLWLMNRTEMPLANLIGHGDVRAYTRDEVRALCTAAGLQPVTLEARKKFRLHLVARKSAD